MLDEQVIAEAVRRALAEIRAGQTKFPDQRLGLERQISLVDARLRHLVDAIASGRSSDAVFVELQREEAAQKLLIGQLSDLERLASVASLNAKRLEKDLQARVADMKGLLGRNIPQTRQMLRKIVDG